MTRHLHLAQTETPADETAAAPEPHKTEHQSGFQIRRSRLDAAKQHTRMDVLQQIYEGRIKSATANLPGAIQREALFRIKTYFDEAVDEERERPFDPEMLDSYCAILEKSAQSQTQANFMDVYRFVQRTWEYMHSQGTRNALERITASQTEERMRARGQSTPTQLLIHLMDIFEDERTNYPLTRRYPDGRVHVKLTNRREAKQVRVMQDIADISEVYPWGFAVLDHAIDQTYEKRERTREWYQMFIDLIFEASSGLRKDSVPSKESGDNAAHVLNLTINLAKAAYKASENDSMMLHKLAELDPNAANDLVQLLKAFEDANGQPCPVPMNSRTRYMVDNALENNGTFKERPENKETGSRDLLKDYHNPTADSVVIICDRLIDAMAAKLEAEKKAETQKNS